MKLEVLKNWHQSSGPETASNKEYVAPSKRAVGTELASPSINQDIYDWTSVHLKIEK
jgi:hypothetical protein